MAVTIEYLWKDRKRYFGLPLSFTRYALSEDRLFTSVGFLSIKDDEILLYRVRDLECAGSAVAFPILRPVFQVCCAVFVAAAAQFFLYNFLGMYQRNFLILTVGLVTGWFIGKMLTEHTTRVFNLHNFCGLAALAAVCAVSFGKR